MLGNQLNPNSSMAQKMHDSLNQEVEAHSIYTSETNSNLIGPQLHSKVVASVSLDSSKGVYEIIITFSKTFFSVLGTGFER